MRENHKTLVFGYVLGLLLGSGMTLFDLWILGFIG